MEDILRTYEKQFDEVKVREEANALMLDSYKEMNIENLKALMSFIDLTSLNSTDSEATAVAICEKVNNFGEHFDGIPNVAGICLYPSLMHVLKDRLNVVDVDRVSVAAGFPASQTFPEIKTMEARMAVENGADEVDIVLNLGYFLEGKYREAYDEIVAVKRVCGDAKLKVILETGVMKSHKQVWDASVIAMEAGADFIKTSTGKLNPAATPDAFLVMAKAVKEFYSRNGRKVGLKAAGGIATVEDALGYFNIVKTVTGPEWLHKDYFRIGASRLANNLLAAIYEQMGGKDGLPVYF